MDRKNDRQLLRLLMQRHRRTQMPNDEMRQLEKRIEESSDLERSYQQLAETWDDLRLPEPQEAPRGFAQDVLEAARKLRDQELSWSLAPAWARFGASMALVTGLGLGMILGDAVWTTSPPESEEAYADADPLSLAEVYWLTFEDGTSSFPDDAETTVGIDQ